MKLLHAEDQLLLSFSGSLNWSSKQVVESEFKRRPILEDGPVVQKLRFSDAGKIEDYVANLCRSSRCDDSPSRGCPVNHSSLLARYQRMLEGLVLE